MSQAEIGCYDLKERLGTGGMGEVWMAIDRRLARPVAIKILASALAGDAEAKNRFHREVRAASALNHPNIVTIFDSGEHDSRLFIAMELIEGRTLREIINNGPIPQEDTIGIARQILQGLTAAHQAGIVHRDIKPENIMLRKDNFVKILDFGLAKILQEPSADSASLTRGIVGTPRYMSPEQATGRRVDERSDVFSVGAVLYEMVTGNPAFQGANIHQILSSIVGPQSPPEITGVPRELISIIFKALVKDPEQRFKSSRQMLQELQSLTLDSPRTAPPPPEEDISIIVVPFSARQEDLDLSAGITDGIIDRISRIRKLRVMSRSVSMKYLGQNPDLLGLGHEMNVRLSLTGSIRRSGERARVIAQLVSNRDGFQIWSERFDFLIRDIFDGEDEISAAVSASIKNYFTRDKEDSAFSLPPASRTDRAASTAQEHYLSALYHLGSYREEDIRKAIDLFKNAIVADPGFSAAYAKLSEACMMMHWSMGNPDSQEFIVLGQEAASRALEIDPANLEAQVSIALSEMNGMQLASSKERLEKVLAQSPNHTGALSWLSYLYTSVGKAGQGEAAARKAVMREPNNANHYIWLSYAQLSQGKYPEAADALDRSVRIDPRNPYAYSLLLFVQLAQGRMTEARLIFDYLEKYGENKPLPEVMKQIYRLKAGLPPASMDCLQMEKLAMDPEAVRLMADVFALAGDREKMMEMLEACAAMGLSNLPFLQTDPFLDEYREDGSFQAMIRRVEQAAGHEGSTMSLARPRAWTN